MWLWDRPYVDAGWRFEVLFWGNCFTRLKEKKNYFLPSLFCGVAPAWNMLLVRARNRSSSGLIRMFLNSIGETRTNRLFPFLSRKTVTQTLTCSCFSERTVWGFFSLFFLFLRLDSDAPGTCSALIKTRLDLQICVATWGFLSKSHLIIRTRRCLWRRSPGPCRPSLSVQIKFIISFALEKTVISFLVVGN